jgi:hypothetical protein
MGAACDPDVCGAIEGRREGLGDCADGGLNEGEDGEDGGFPYGESPDSRSEDADDADECDGPKLDSTLTTVSDAELFPRREEAFTAWGRRKGA